jgi:large subunit ribosomal protein L10
VGPAAITFVHGDVAATAKALKEFSKTNPLLVIRGGVVANKAISAKDVEVLADLPPREVLLAQFAGLLQAPLVRTAGLLQALPRNTAYGLKALIDQKEAA